MTTSEVRVQGDAERGSAGAVRRIRVTVAEKMAAQYLVERAEATGKPVRPAYRAIANAK